MNPDYLIAQRAGRGIALFVLKLVFRLSIVLPVGADQRDVAGELSEEFKGYSISLIEGQNLGAKAFLYEFPNNTLEVLSRQNLLGVIVIFDKDGSIKSVRPKSIEVRIPDQGFVNKFIDGGKSMTDLLKVSEFEKMDPIQMFGLLTKWATAVLSASNDVAFNLELEEDYRKIVVRLLSGNMEWPENAKDLSREEIKALAKKIVRIEELNF
jgi:hypothetical protein